eukprot:gnl/Spiro4/7076_TR3680_c0_g2_i1.p1 gnl/Spiro4/7076_TR3680_c0_g2~~gnl/Spiro4/7076_TR3680_c0_g2_i1.p1  ORF type:complete len:108 (+),score=6.21 gnl/Spiro4/7076_TR3680_c0_g2_i1:39-362(+)
MSAVREFFKSVGAAHTRLKKKIHGARYPLTWGQYQVAKVLYFSVPFFGCLWIFVRPVYHSTQQKNSPLHERVRNMRLPSDATRPSKEETSAKLYHDFFDTRKAKTET